MPDLKLSGKIIDSKTGKLVPSSGANNGTFLKVFEGDSKQPLLFNTEPDGKFKNTRVFPASYRIVAIGPFNRTKDTIKININKDTKIDIKVVPNVRLNLTSNGSGAKTAKVKIGYNKINNKQKLMKIGVVWSTYPHPNVTIFPGGDIISENIASMGLTEGEKVYKMTQLKSNTKYFVRAFAITNNAGNYYNYSEQIIIETK
jgi:hypothetical protein